jgi:hypothetical protein
VARNLKLGREVAKKLCSVLRKYKYVEAANEIQSSITDYGSTEVTVIVQGLPLPALKEILEQIPQSPENSQARAYVQTLIRLATDVESKIGKMDTFPEAFNRWLTVKSIDGWLYTILPDGETIAWAVESSWYEPEKGTGDNYTPASAGVKLYANRGGTYNFTIERIYLSRGDIVGKSVGEVILAEGFFKETEELKAAYTASIKRFTKFQPMHNQQFSGHGKSFEIEGNWSRDVDTVADNTRLVNDEATIDRSVTLKKSNHKWPALRD